MRGFPYLALSKDTGKYGRINSHGAAMPFDQATLVGNPFSDRCRLTPLRSWSGTYESARKSASTIGMGRPLACFFVVHSAIRSLSIDRHLTSVPLEPVIRLPIIGSTFLVPLIDLTVFFFGLVGFTSPGPNTSAGKS